MTKQGQTAVVNSVQYDIPPADAEEEALAKFVFGDTVDFQTSLADFNLDFLTAAKEDEVLESYNDEALASDEDNNSDHFDDVNDDQLFFVDDGKNEDHSDAMSVDESGEQDSSEDEYSDDSDDANDVAWVDSDDEKLKMTITTTNKTKKLRTSYSENKLSGKDYVRRLRAQFEKIYPRPKWVDEESDDEDMDSNASDVESNKENVINGDMNALSKMLEITYQYKDLSNSKLIPPKQLDIVRLKDANASHVGQSAIQSLSFHPYKPLLLTGGYDRTLRIYQIDGKNNHLVTSLYLKGTPIQSCNFYVSPIQNLSNKRSVQEQKIFTGGRRRYMHSWDLSSSLASKKTANSQAMISKITRLYGHEDTQRSFEKFKTAHFYNSTTNVAHGIVLLQGNNGWVNILHATNGIWMMGCKIEGVISDFCVDYKQLSDNKFKTILIAVNTYGGVYEFDLNENGKITRKWKDEGGVGITTIQVGGGTTTDNLFPVSSEKVRVNRWLAIGSESGYVNVYDRKLHQENPKPVATLDQLTTSISSIQFSHDGQILCIASRAVKDALRLIHLPSFTVFANWPTSGTPLGKVTAVGFSSRSEMLVVGNEQGKVRLWKLNHY